MLNAIPDRWTDIEVVGPAHLDPHQPAKRLEDPTDSVHRRRLISQRPQRRRDVSAASEYECLATRALVSNQADSWAINTNFDTNYNSISISCL